MEWPANRGVGSLILHQCVPPTRAKQRRWRSRRSSRRLITLVFAGRNRMLVIRRELPRTENEDGARRACRTKDMRILLFVSPSTATRTALLVGMESLRSNSVLLELSFHLDTDGPDEPCGNDSAILRLAYAVTRDGNRVKIEEPIQIVTTQPY